MKKKSIFFTLLIFLFGFAGSFFSLLPKDEKVANADTGLSNISVWNGQVPTHISSSDFFQNGDDYYIRTARGFAYLVQCVNTNHNEMQGKTMYLETDIDLKDRPWSPIGNGTYSFSGTFDGQGHSIYGITRFWEKGDNVGLFGSVSGTIKNLHIKNANFTSSAKYVGALAGSSSGTISGCSLTGTITATTADYLGGLVGQNSGAIKLCYSKATLTGKNVGGICGSSTSQILQCANYSSIESTGFAGGIVASSSSTTSECFNHGEISAPTAGGIVGQLSAGKLNCSYNIARISGTNAGGLAGVISGSVQISNSFSLNHGTQNLAVNTNSNIFSYVYSDTESQFGTITLPALAEEGSISGISIAKTRGFYENPYYWADISSADVETDWVSPWDFEDVWKISSSENNGFVMLKHLYDGENPNNEATYTKANGLLGSGTYLDPYQIWTAGDFGWLSFHYNDKSEGEYIYHGKYFALQKNINLSGKTWKPLYGGENIENGITTTIPFEGVFDGNGYTISGLTSSTQNSFTYYGLFGKTENAVIKNLVLDAKYLTFESERSGALIGEAGKNTYVVNVVTLSENVQSIGYASDNIYVAYGKLNEERSQEINKAVGVEPNRIYDVTLNTNGGIVYNKDICAYAGQPHILLNASDNVVIQNIDKTYLKNLPTSTSNYGTKDIIAKVGYSFEIWNPSNITQGGLIATTAMWNYQGAQTFKLIYNGTSFISSSNRESHDYDYANLQVDANGDVYIPVEYYYNDFYGNFSTLYTSSGDLWIPKSSTKILRDGYFEIADFYTENSTFSTKIQKNMFCIGGDIYAAWQGIEEKSYTLTIKLESNPSDSFAKLSDDEIDRVIKDMKISFKEESQDFAYNSTTNAFIFSIPTAWVDEAADAFNIKISLLEGYEFDAEKNVKVEAGTHEDRNFGYRTPYPYYNFLISEGGQDFKNFADDYTITLYAKKKYQQIWTLLSNGAIYALTPNITGYTSIQVNNASISIPTGSPVFGIDMNGNYIFANDTISATAPNPQNEFRVVYTLPSGNRYIKYTKIDNAFKMYECDSSWANRGFLADFVYLNPSGYTHYYTNANFGIIAQVSDLASKSFKITRPTELTEGDNNFRFINTENFYVSQDYNGSIGEQKSYKKFDTLEYTTNDAQIIFQEELSSVILNTKFAYYGSNVYSDDYFDSKTILRGSTINLENGSTNSINISGGTFSFSLSLTSEAEKRYKLHNQDSAILYNGDNYNFKLVGTDENGQLIAIQGFSMEHVSGESVYSLKTSNALPGNYTLYIYLTDVIYELAYETKYIYTGHSTEFQEFEGASILRNDISIGNSGAISSLLYDEEISLKAQLNATPEGNINSYVFGYWYILDTSTKLSAFDEIEFSRDYNSILANLSSYTIYAVYKQKNITLRFSDSILVQDFGGLTGNDQIVQNDNFVLSSFGAEISSADSNGYNNFNGLNLTLNNSALNLLGYQVVDSTNDPLDDSDLKVSDWGAIHSEINLKGAFQRLRNAGLTEEEQIYYLVPIVSQKSISVNYYSGTGTGSAYGDQKDGEVLNVDNPPVVKTDAVLVDTKYYGTISDGRLVEYSLNLNNSQFGGIVPKNVFFRRVGYSKLGFKYTYSDSSSTDDLDVNAAIFDLKTDVFAHQTLNFYITWTPNDYTIGLNGNNGQPTYQSVTATFDSAALSPIPSVPTRTGYIFGGWTASHRGWSISQDADDIVIDTEGNFVERQDYTKNIEDTIVWHCPSDVVLYAYWIPKTLEVSLNAGGGTQETATVYVVYDGISIYSTRTGGDYPYSVSSQGIINPIATRAGFNFLGYFDDQTQIIDSEGSLNSIWTSSDIDGKILTAKWTYDESYFDLSFENTIFEGLTFNGNDQEVRLSELLTIQNTVRSGFIIDFTKTIPLTLIAGENNDLNSTLTMSATLNGDITTLNSFSVKNAGQYQYVLTATIIDDIENRIIWTRDYTFDLSVEKANLSITIDESKSKNLKRLMQNFVSTSDLATIFADLDITNVANRLKTFSADSSLDDITLSEEEQDEGTTIADKIIDYFTVKYYLMAHTNSTDYKTFKDWTYTEYVSYQTQNVEQVEEILERARLFDYFDYTNTDKLQEFSAYDFGFDIFENDSEDQNDDYDPATTLAITSLKIVTDTTFSARQSYQIRVYISGSDLENYQYLYDEEENAYIMHYESVYLMPQILFLENQAEIKQSYYDDSEKEIGWQGNRSHNEFDEIEIYRVNTDQNFFVGAKLLTSNAGNNQVDTEFAFASQTNYLYFTNVYVLLYSATEEYYRNLTDMFTLVVPQEVSNNYTILGVSGVNRITLSTKSLSMRDGSMIFEDVDATITDSEFVTLYSISYTTISGIDKTADFADGVTTGQQFVDEGILLFEVFESTNYKISIQVSKQVKSISFATKTATFEYFGLYTWSTSETMQIDGTMTTSDTYKFENVVDENASNIREYDLYVVYTDIVLGTYDLNLPSFVTNSFNTTIYIKRGQTTAQSITKPNQTGLKFSKLVATGNWNDVDYAQIFTGENQTYIGHDPEGQGYRAYFAPVYLKALWMVEDIEYRQKIDNYSCQIKNFESLYFDEIIDISNQNENFYTYSYDWYKLNTATNKFDQISNSSRLVLPQNGSYEESGRYKLVIRADIIESLKKYLDSETAYYSVTDENPETTNDAQETILIDLEFMRRKVSSITLPENESAQAIYSNKDFSGEILINYSYYAYLASQEDYADEADEFESFIGGNSGLSFEITKSGASVEEIKNVGNYSINVVFDPTIFELESGLNTIFEFAVLPKEIDLSSYSIAFSKTLNTADPELVKAINVLLGTSNQEIVIEFMRGLGEVVGQYDLFVDSITSENPENYKLLKNDVVLYENGTRTTESSTTSVGTFSIEKTGNLVLSWTISSENPSVLTTIFSEAGYTYQIDTNKNFILKDGATAVKQIALTLFDVSTKSYIADTEILSMISSEFANSTFKFTKDSVDFTKIEDCGTYSFKVEGSTRLLDNFATVTFDVKHGLLITPQEISTSFSITKTFNNSKILNLSTSGSEILDLSIWNDLYIEANFATEHVGTDIAVSLTLKTKDSNKHISNYYLSSQNKTGTITKLNAEFSATLTNLSYIYGEVAYDNIKALISSFSLQAGTQNVTGWASSGRYTISYFVDNSVQRNAYGYLYKATDVDVFATINFADFEITNAISNVVNIGSFDITELNKTIYVQAGHIKVWEGDTLESQYTEDYAVSQTNDTLTLTFNVGGLTSDDGASKYYAISLDQTSFLSGSVVISATGDLENGLLVYKNDTTIKLYITDNSIFSAEYNGEEYTIEFDNTNSNIVIKNGEDAIGTSAVSYKDENDNVLSSSIVDSISIQSNTTLTKVGSYTLSVTASLTGYSSLIFAQPQTFTISPKTINVPNLSIEKDYDGYASCRIEDFAEKVDSDNVYLLANFSSPSAGQNKSVSLTLQGTDATNYTLSTSSTTGTINKAHAQIILNKTEYIYGAIYKTTKDFIIQGSEGQLPIEGDISIKYVLASDETTEATYSSLNYLTVGTYKLKIADQTNNSYTVEEPSETISVSPYMWNIVLTTAGVETAEYGSSTLTFEKTLTSPLHENITLEMTRAAGEDVGYYPIVSAVVKNNPNYIISSIIDQSEGYYQITRPFDNIYILASDEQTIDASGKTASELVSELSLDIEYDGNVYDGVKLDGDSTTGYKFVVYNRARESVFKEFTLNAYSYDTTTSIYTKLAGPIGGLSGTFALNRAIRYASGDESNSFITTSASSAENYNVAFGPYMVNASNSFLVKITPRKLYIKSDVVSESTNNPGTYLFTREFTNKNAVYDYENAADIFDGIVIGDMMGLTLTFKNGAEIAKYVSNSYNIEATLSGDSASNYQTETKTKITDENEVTTICDVFGRISKASMSFIINSQNFTYGEYKIDQEWINTNNFEADHQVIYSYSTDIDLTDYDMSRINIILRAGYNPLTDFSSSNCLIAKTYGAYLNIILEDFDISKYILDGIEYDNWGEGNIDIRVVKKNLSLLNGTQTLTEIFTKKYDEMTDIEIYDGANLKFNIEGIESGDEFVIDSASYKSALPGASIEIEFVTSGADKNNYFLPNYPSGAINPIKVNIAFDYDRNTIYSNVDNNNLPTLSLINFPFVSQTYLTSNSSELNTTTTKSFPTSLFVAGKSFSGWRLNFAEVSQNGTKHNYLSNLSTSLNIESFYEDEVFGFKVGNDYKTVSLLGRLIGQDIEDICGMYYQNHDNQTITFTPVWSTNKYTIEISIENAATNERSTEVGEVKLESDGVEAKEINKVSPAATGNIQVEYHKTVVITAKPKAHCYFYGFSGQGGDYVISGDNGEILTISNIQSNYTIKVKFAIINAKISYDLSEYPNSEFSSTNFTQKSNRVYTWTTDYLSVENTTLSQTDLSNITLDGYDFIGIRKGNQEILIEDFEERLLSGLLDDDIDTSGIPVSIATFTPMFSEKQIDVTLDYGYDDITDTIQINFNQKYTESPDWDATPQERTGYIFEGWYLDSQFTSLIDDQTKVTNSQAHSVYAKWSKKSSALRLNFSHANISDSTLTFTEGEGYVSAEEVEFETEISFTIIAEEGYQIKNDGWHEIFETSSVDGWRSAQVSFAMPGDDFEAILPVGVLTNSVRLTLTNIKTTKAYDITNEEVEIEIVSNVFEIDTGKTIKIVAIAEDGYQVSDELILIPSVEVSNKTKTETTLTFEVSGVVGATEIQIFAYPRTNAISFNFESDEFENARNAIERIVIQERTYAGDDLRSFESISAQTGQTITGYFKLKHGYIFDEAHSSSSDFEIGFSTESEGAYSGWTKIVVSGINKDGQIKIAFVYDTFEIDVEVIAYDASKNRVDGTENYAYINGSAYVSAKYNSLVELSYETAENYSFVYWSKDGLTELSKENNYSYTVQDNQTIYAIFSTFKYQIRVAAKEFIKLERESGQAGEIYKNISTTFILPTSMSDSLDLYFGQNITIGANCPRGYYYYGMAFERDEELIYIDRVAKFDETVEITIASDSLSAQNAPSDVSLYAIFVAKEATINIQSYIDIDGTRLSNHVGEITLVSSNGEDANSYGYIEGTLIHYSPSYFSNGQPTSKTNFEIITNTGKDVYIKISNIEDGYRFLKLLCSNASAEVVQTRNGIIIYKITNIYANANDINVVVLFKPKLSNISITFESEGITTRAGALGVETTAEFENRIFTDTTSPSKLIVSAYTDTRFTIKAFIKAGFYIDRNASVIVDLKNLVPSTTISFTTLDINETGYTGVLTFDVTNYKGDSEIKILVQKTKYVVALQEGNQILAKIHNVSYGSLIDLSEENSENIEILDRRLHYESEKLFVSLKKENCNFEGFFTYENGAGIRYIDSEGQSSRDWEESGYILNTHTSKYELGSNAQFDAETGETTISLYIYWSYLKTRITFTIVPQIATNFTAQEIVKGVDYTNSWFYTASPMYIEVSFNTDIHITAPDIYGYSFYKFIINQKDLNGTWLNPVISYSNDIPWSTNDVDKIVECEIEIQYFAKIDVEVVGGQAGYTIEQSGSDEMARRLMLDGYVDTTKDFTIKANPSTGYEFQRWYDWSNTRSIFDSSYTSKTDRLIMMTLTVQGGSIDLTIPYFDQTYGNVSMIISTSPTGEQQAYEVGAVSERGFSIKGNNPPSGKNPIRVGDTIRLLVEAEYGFSILWNRSDIVFEKYEQDTSYFVMTIAPSMAGREIEIFPMFNSQILSVYIAFDFEEGEKDDLALDRNVASVAGSAWFDNKETKYFTIEKNKDIEIDLKTNPRYYVSSLNLNNYANSYDIFEKLEDGKLVLSRSYLSENQIVGTLQISAKFSRNYWIDADLTDIELLGSGSSRDPYRITTEKHLTLIMRLINNGEENSSGKKYSNCHYIVEKDLDLTQGFWTPIGTEANPFAGSFNFAGHSINGVSMSRYFAPIVYNGLFGVVDPSARITLKNTSLWHIYLAVGLSVGVVVAVPTLTILARSRRKRRQRLSTK